ncbi:MAG: hypothetical protein KJP25_01420 [Gammaproteobacteria bacterium]|nr:hypothetical protein [Gammaproteobacteria bacterium]
MKYSLNVILCLAVTMCLAGCIDSETTFEAMLGSWEEQGGEGFGSCIHFTSEGVYEVFIKKPAVPKEKILELKEASDFKEKLREFLGTAYATGWWTAGRGSRYSMRGSVARDQFGLEIPLNDRALNRVAWFSVKFPSAEEFHAQNLRGEPEIKQFKKVEDCDHFEKDVNMVFDDKLVPQVDRD